MHIPGAMLNRLPTARAPQASRNHMNYGSSRREFPGMRTKRTRGYLAFLTAAALSLLGLLALPARYAAAAGTGSITITNPGTQNTYDGDAVYLQIHAKDSNPGATLSYTADLPGGLAIDPQTGVISGRPTSPGAVIGDSVTVSDTGGASATTVSNWVTNNVFEDTPVGPVRSAYAGKCLDDKDGKTTTGNPIQLWSCNGDAAQNVIWNNNSLEVMGRCVDDPGASEVPGTPMRLAPCNNGGESQFLSPGRGGILTLIGPDSPYCIDAPHSANGTRLVLGVCASGRPLPTGGRWIKPSTSMVLGLDGKCLGLAAMRQLHGHPGLPRAAVVYSNGAMINPRSGKCLDDPFSRTANGIQLDICTCNGQVNQRWSSPQSPIVSEVPGTCLTGRGTDAPNGSTVLVARCTSDPATPTAAEQWTFTGGTLRSQGNCLDVLHYGTATGTPVQVYSCLNGDAAQQWGELAGGLLRNPHSGKCLAFPGAAPQTGTALVIKPCAANAAAEDEWHLIENFRMTEPSRVYPAAKFICLFRHPMDVIASGVEVCPWGLHRFGFEPFVAQYPGNSVAAIGSYWLACAQAMLAFADKHPQACHRVRYEDLVTAPEETAAAIFTFLGAEGCRPSYGRPSTRRSSSSATERSVTTGTPRLAPSIPVPRPHSVF